MTKTDTKRYEIDFGTGAGNFEVTGTIDDAKKATEDNLAYTQESVSITCDGVRVACLPWYGTEPNESDEVTAQFGSFGFYGAWSA